MVSRNWFLARMILWKASLIGMVLCMFHIIDYYPVRCIIGIAVIITTIIIYIFAACPHCKRRGRHGLYMSLSAADAGCCNFCGKRVEWKEYADEYILDDED